ncbi:MAG TPA: L-lactate permease [Bacillota bacterium]|nr:L-lactate permease [Bacillota bacterium]
MEIFLTLLPVLVIFLCLTVWSKPADVSGVIGWIVSAAVAVFAFGTPVKVVLLASLAGLLISLPVTLVVVTSIWQISFMEATKALKRVVIFVKTLARDNLAVQIMMINIGMGTLLVSVGATPVSILPPIMLALGYSTYLAVALPALGYDALCTFSLLGAPLVVFSDITKISLPEAGFLFAKFLPVISTLLAYAMLWMVGGGKLLRKGFLPATISGLVIGVVSYLMAPTTAVVSTGVIAGLATVLAMVVYHRLTGGTVIDDSLLSPEEQQLASSYPLWRAISPWLILVVVTLTINFNDYLRDLLYKQLPFAVSVIPGEFIKTRILWNAYTWIVVSTILAIPLMKATGQELTESLAKWRRRAPRPALAAAIFFAVAYVMNYSGFQDLGNKWELISPQNNMIFILADQSASLFGSFYPFIASFLGLLGGFITGSEASSIAMFTKYNFTISDFLKFKPLIIMAGTAIGGGLASVISPAKLQNAAATIDAIGIENKVIKTAMVVAFFLTAAAGLMTLLLAK